jgi:DNA gyrase inhibitor GyrI
MIDSNCVIKFFTWGIVMVWIALLVVAAGALAYLLSLPKGYTVKRSIVIAKPLPEVFDYIVDFNNWNAWSPWLLHEPDAPTRTFDGAAERGVHRWNGERIGAGQMTHKRIVQNDRIDIKLELLSPRESTSDVSWQVVDASSGGAPATQVIWTLVAQMPLPFRPFQNFIAKMIGYDFALGLALLRGKLNPSSEHPKLAFDGVVSRAAQTYVTEYFEGTLGAMKDVMKDAYPRLWNAISADTERWEQKPSIAAYHKVKFMRGTTVMDMGLAVKHLNAGEAGLALPAGRYFQMTLRGSYEFLPSSWNTIYGQIKMQGYKIDKTRPSLEVYQTNPMQVPNSNDWVTLLCVPLK